MKLHLKIALVALAVSAVALAAGYTYVVPVFRTSLTESIEKAQDERLKTLALLLTLRPREKLTPGQIQDYLAGYAGAGQGRFLLLDSAGYVVADSNASQPVLARSENQLNRPEVIRSGENPDSGGRHVALAPFPTLYLARRVHLPDGENTLRLIYPLDAVENAVSRVRNILWGAAGLSLLLAGSLGLLISRWITAPIREVADATARISEGDFTARVRSRAEDEVGVLARNFDRMAERLEQTISAFEFEREQAERILSTVHEGLILLDRDNRVVVSNQAFGKLFGAGTPAITGRSPLEIVRTDKLEDAFEAISRGGEVYEGEFTLEGPGSERTFELSAAPIRELGERTGAVMVFRDVTRTRRLERIRRDFVANVSHELRTPLTSIHGYAETLAARLDKHETYGKFVEAILRNSERLTSLVNDLLDLSRIERPDFRLEQREDDLASVIQANVESHQAAAAQKDIRLGFSPGEFPHRLGFDRNRIDQVLTNLLDNAIKYTPSGGSVTVTTVRGPAAVTVNVTDTGPGIPVEDQARVFERFYRVDKHRSRELGGTGLGLAIVKHIVALHKGQSGVESIEGQGARFWFSLPLGPAEPGSQTSSRNPAA